jgi:hypothetical protein
MELFMEGLGAVEGRAIRLRVLAVLVLLAM